MRNKQTVSLVTMMNDLVTPLLTPASSSADVRHFENRIDPLLAKKRGAEEVKYNSRTRKSFYPPNDWGAVRHISSQSLDH
jgi:hypothetical protein